MYLEWLRDRPSDWQKKSYRETDLGSIHFKYLGLIENGMAPSKGTSSLMLKMFKLKGT